MSSRLLRPLSVGVLEVFAGLGAGEVAFIPRGARATLLAGPDGIQAVSFGTVITDK